MEAVVRERKRRFKPEVRKAQIIEVTRQLILENGLDGATVLNIAKALNISQATLYYHFKNRREILLDTFKGSIEEIMKSLPSQMDDAAQFLRTFSRAVYQQTIRRPERARLFFELLSAPPDVDMREEIQKQISGLHAIFEIAIKKGIQQGIFRDDIDVKLIGWELMSFGITTCVGSMLELPNFISLEQGMQSIDRILDYITRR